jgi:dTDP-4-dehydrorhamnose reductase
MKVLILGASGIIGQHLRRWQPGGDVEPLYTSRQHLPWGDSVKKDFQTDADVEKFCDKHDPDVIINLIGENRPDLVELDPGIKSWFSNVEIPLALKRWIEKRQRWLIHVSTQAVYGGLRAPYYSGPVLSADVDPPVNTYGKQKLKAEHLLMLRERETQVIIVRLTFILGIRPFPDLGRTNPLEMMYDDYDKQLVAKQVTDRMFSPCFANDAAAFLWQLVGTLHHLEPLLDRFLTRKRYFNIGLPMQVTRAAVSIMAQANLRKHRAAAYQGAVDPVKHARAFPKAAKRPHDTTFNSDAVHDETWEEALNTTTAEWRIRMDRTSEHDRALELALFFGIREGEARVQLMRGFGVLHQEVAKDFRAAKSMKTHSWTDFDLLQWYKKTPAYCWELSAYHLDKGFNYTGMCQGIAEHIVKTFGEGATVICLGDGIGDLTMDLLEHKLDAVYHDLLDSQTARFAAFRFQRHAKTPLMWLTDGWEPPNIERAEMLKGKIKVVVALDFFEHMTDVEGYVKAVYDMLSPGGMMIAVNAFGIGDEEHGDSIPMHLSRNNVYADPDKKTGEAGWDVLTRKIGFVDLKNGWRQKPEGKKK